MKRVVHETPGAPVRIGRYAIDARGNRIKLSPLVDVAYADATGDPTLPPCRDLDEQGNVIRFPSGGESEDVSKTPAP